MRMVWSPTWAGRLGWVGVTVWVLLLALPGTRWVVRRDVLLAKGEVVHWNEDVTWASVEDKISQTAPKAGKGVSGRLTWAVLKDGKGRLAALDRLSDAYPKDPFVQAVLGRYASWFWSGYRRDRQRSTVSEAARARSAMLLTAARCGRAVEPENAYFDLLEAVGHLFVRDLGRARTSLLNAGGKTTFDSRLRLENDLLRRWYRAEVQLGSCFEDNVIRFQVGPYVDWARILLEDLLKTAANRRGAGGGIARPAPGLTNVGWKTHPTTRSAILGVGDRAQPVKHSDLQRAVTGRRLKGDRSAR